ncbi:MAG: endonuclease Q family protein [Pseudomonadota bacterium]
MEFIADFHIHSHYSIATSKNLVPEELNRWGKIKGIDVIGTGDCIHPGWQAELKEKLKPSENGLFQLKKNHQSYFMLTGEISSIYKKNGKCRKNHNICVFPDFKSAKKVSKKLDKIGNINSDGRPILGLDSKNLLEIVLESSEKAFLIPAHIWTPWFSLFGSKSGFDTIEECFEDLTAEIFALETGLSSDPEMNRYLSSLDRYTLVSNSDAHSCEKLGREANLFDTDLSYDGIYNSLKTKTGFKGTIEFFPEEGKYHLDGHRKCGIAWTPEETKKHKGICPVCNKEVTKGVLYRVMELADRKKSEKLEEFKSITSLASLLAQTLNKKNPSCKTVQNKYFELIEKLGSEFHILLNEDIENIKEAGEEKLALGIYNLRNKKVIIKPGFDGEFGKVSVFENN